MNVWENQILESITSKDSQGAIKLIKQGFPINYSIKSRNTLNSPQPGFSTLLIESISHNLQELCSFLLDTGVSVNTVDSLGRHPVHLAAYNGNIEILQLLVDHNANIAARDALGNTILHISATSRHLNFVQYLVEKIKFPVAVFNKMMQKPLDSCKHAQENSKSLQENEELERILQYLWRKEEEYKKNTNDKILKYSISPQMNNNQRVCRMKKHGIDADCVQVPVFAFKKPMINLTPFKGRQTIQSYLKDKHEAIREDMEDKLANSTFSNYRTRSPSPRLRLPKIKGMSF